MGSFSSREKVIVGVLVLLLVAGVAWKAIQIRGPGVEGVEYIAPQPSEEVEEEEFITSHLVGQVNNPGIYRLPVGSRVYEVLEEAGGVTPEADLDRVNLARPLYDGEQLHIVGPCNGDDAGPGEEKININLASAEELMTLPGIGAGRAQRIIEHRDRYGYFTELNQLMEVSGIGEGIFSGLEELITIY